MDRLPTGAPTFNDFADQLVRLSQTSTPGPDALLGKAGDVKDMGWPEGGWNFSKIQPRLANARRHGILCARVRFMIVRVACQILFECRGLIHFCALALAVLFLAKTNMRKEVCGYFFELTPS